MLMKTKKLLSWLLPVLFLSACGEQKTTALSPVEPAQLEELKGADMIPLAVGEAMAVGSQIMSGGITAQNVNGVASHSVLLEDLYGQPFYRLTIVAKDGGQDKDFWSVVDRVPTGVSVVGTGATTARTLYAFEYDETFIKHLKATKEKAGSIKRLVVPDGGIIWLEDEQGRYWSIQSESILPIEAVDNARVMYDKLLEQFPSYKEELQVEWKGFLSQQAAKQLVSGASVQSVKAKNDFGDYVKKYTTDKGFSAADFAKAELKQAAKKPITAQAWYDNRDVADHSFWGRIKSYAGIAGSDKSGAEVMSMGKNIESDPDWKDLKKLDFGNRQDVLEKILNDEYYKINDIPNPNRYDLPVGKEWGIRGAFLNIGAVRESQNKKARLVGCVPLGYARMFATLVQKTPSLKREMIAKGVFSSYDSLDEQLRKTVASLMYPVQAENMPSNIRQPYATNKMGGGHFQGGTMVTPHGLVDGGNTILNEKLMNFSSAREIGLRFDGWGWANVGRGIAAGSSPFTYWGITGDARSAGHLGFFGFNNGTRWVRDMVRRQMKDNGLPVMFLYSTGDFLGLGGHMGISGAYRSLEYILGYSDVFVYTAHNDNGGEEVSDSQVGWINVTNRWSAYGGVWALSPKWK